ncbi:hypothetical protein ACIBHY_36165 [Nonomuraea sp. NPDC050547]|uniref:hypothetical protein n=1 Tax=Nonomuraea sp. NPDC050547 TaxID=3364368 RepID=UPI0037A74E45
MFGKKTGATLGIIAATTFALSTLTANPAAAVGQSAAAGQAGVPSCVGYRVFNHRTAKYVTIANNCRYKVRIKVVIAWGPDSPCMTIAANGRASWRWARGHQRFDGLRKC